MKDEILLIPDKPDIERDKLAEEWVKQKGEVRKIGKFWIKPEIDNQRISIYGYDTFCLVLAQILELDLISVKDEEIAKVEEEYLKRKVTIKTLAGLDSEIFPKFIKPVIPKLFKAQVFQSKEDFSVKIKNIEEHQKLICSEIVMVEHEVRAFILDREIIELAFYEGIGKIDEAKSFIESFLKSTKLKLPKTFVIDIGYNEINKWFIIEFNSTWGAGLNFCKPSKVIQCIREATIN